MNSAITGCGTVEIKTYRCYGCKFPCEDNIIIKDNEELKLTPCPFGYTHEWILKGSIAELKEIEHRKENAKEQDIEFNLVYANVHGWKQKGVFKDGY